MSQIFTINYSIGGKRIKWTYRIHLHHHRHTALSTLLSSLYHPQCCKHLRRVNRWRASVDEGFAQESVELFVGTRKGFDWGVDADAIDLCEEPTPAFRRFKAPGGISGTHAGPEGMFLGV